MNAVATIRQPTKLEKFIGEVLPADQRQDFFRVLPKHISPERFERAVANVLMNTPEMMNADPQLIFREISKVVGLGLMLDPQLGEAYLILGWNAKTRQKEPQVRVGYKGLIKLAKQSGEILNIYAREVHEKDAIECIQGDENRLVHKPLLFTDRGAIVGYYAVVKYKSGEIDFEPMSIAQINEIRDRSDGWKAFSEGRIKSTPWSTDHGEMAKKTVLRRLQKRVSQSPDLNAAVAIEDSAEFAAFDRPSRNDLPPPATRTAVARQPQQQVIEHAPAEAAGAPDHIIASEKAVADAANEDGVVSADELLTELDDRLGHAKTADEVEEGYTDFDAEALLSDYENGVPRARKLKADHLERVGAAAAPVQQAAVQPAGDDDFPGNEALERARAQHPPGLRDAINPALVDQRDPWAIPESFTGGGPYQVFVRRACAATIKPEDEAKLRNVWSGTASHRQDLAEREQLVAVDVTTLKNEVIAAFDRVRALAQPDDGDLPPPAPRRAAPATQPAEQAPPPAEAPPPAAKPVSADPVAAYTADMEAAFKAAKTKEEVDRFWFGTTDRRDEETGADEDQRSRWRLARNKAKSALPNAEG